MPVFYLCLKIVLSSSLIFTQQCTHNKFCIPFIFVGVVALVYVNLNALIYNFYKLAADTFVV